EIAGVARLPAAASAPAPTADFKNVRRYMMNALMSLRVVAVLVPVTPIVFARCLLVRGRRDKPGDDAGMWLKSIEIRSRAAALPKRKNSPRALAWLPRLTQAEDATRPAIAL